MKGYSFDAEKHHHLYNGKRMYGCTSVLQHWGDKSGLINWAANCAVDYIESVAIRSEKTISEVKDMLFVSKHTLEQALTAHTKKRDKAGDNGTKVHGLLEVKMNEWIETSTPPLCDGVVKKVVDWMIAEGYKPVRSELPVYSTKYFYAGILDLVIEKIDTGERFIADFKTSGYVYTTAFIQCGAYSFAAKEMKKEAKIAGVIVIHIPRGTSFNPEKNVYHFFDTEALETAFLNILSTYKTDQALQKLIKW